MSGKPGLSSNQSDENEIFLNKSITLFKNKDFYKGAQCLAETTKEMIEVKNIKGIRACFNTAQKFYLIGNKIIQHAITNVYLFSLSFILDNKNEYSDIKKELPEELKKAYNKQLSNSLP